MPTTLLGLLNANLLNGLSYGWWIDKHNAHHAHPSDLEADPDVLPGLLKPGIRARATELTLLGVHVGS